MEHFNRLITDLKNGEKWLTKNGDCFTHYEIKAIAKNMSEDELNYKIAPVILDNINKMKDKLSNHLSNNLSNFKISTLKKQLVLRIVNFGTFYFDNVDDIDNLDTEILKTYKTIKEQYMLIYKDNEIYFKRGDDFKGVLGFKPLPKILTLRDSKGVISDTLYNYLVKNKQNCCLS